MTKITLTFLFHFVIAPVESGKTPEKEGKKEKKAKKEKKTKKEKIAPVIDLEKEAACMTITVTVKKPVSYLHMEYNILPKLPPYKIDILFWGPVAKVYVNNTAKSIKPLQRNEQHYWITFSIVHDFTLILSDLLLLKSHIVNFTITSSKKKIGKVAKKDKVKAFSFWKEDINTKTDFVQAYEDLADMEPWPEFKNMLLDLLNFSIEDEYITFLKIFPDGINCLKSINIIEKIMAKKPVNILNSEEAGRVVKDLLKSKSKGKKGKKGKGKGKEKGKNKKGGKAKKGKKKKSDTTIKLSMPAETFFTDPSTVIDFKSANKEIIHAFVVIQVDELININTIENLYPIIIKIEEIQHLPVDILAKNGFSQMYTTYKIANDDQVSFARSISNNICFKEHHIHFISDLFMLGLVEQLQTGYLVVQIHGIIEVKADAVKPINYSNVGKVLLDKNEILDIYEDEILKSAKSVLLAEAHFALDALLNPFWAFAKSIHCQSPNNIYSKQVQDTYNKITTNSITLQENTNPNSPITDDVILINNLTLAVEVKLCRPLLYRLHSYQKANDNFNRIILVIYDLNLAKLILTTVMINNTATLENKDTLPNYLAQPDVMPTLTLLTGFVIDCRNFYFIFLEGIVYMIENLIWDLVKYESVDTLKAFYNSDYIFGDRIYTNFMSMGGVLNITLFQPLLMIFNEKKCILRGFLPEPCRKVLLKLNLILQSQFLLKITSNILPTDKELLSLDLEWGVPLYCTN